MFLEENIENIKPVKAKRAVGRPKKSTTRVTRRIKKDDRRSDYHEANLATRYAWRKKHADTYINKNVRCVNYTEWERDEKRGVFYKPEYILERLYNDGHAKSRYNILSSSNKTTWRKRPIEQAINYSFIRVNVSEVCYYIIIDVDSTTQEQLMERFKELGIYPNLMIGSPDRDDSWHLWFGLQYTEYQTYHLLERTKNLLTILLFGDTNYNNHFSRSPFSHSFKDYTYFFDIANYDIDDLYDRCNAAIERRPAKERKAIKNCLAQFSYDNKYTKHLMTTISSGSRNVDTFFLFTREVRAKIMHDNRVNKGKGKTNKSKQSDYLTRYLVKNIASSYEHVINGLPEKEVKQIAKSVVNYNLDKMNWKSKYAPKSIQRDCVLDKLIHQMINAEKDVKEAVFNILKRPLKNDAAEILMGLFEAKKEHIFRAAKIIREMFNLVDKREKNHIEDTVLEVKRARYESIADREGIREEEVQKRNRLREIAREGRKVRDTMRANGATEEEIKRRLAFDRERYASVKHDFEFSIAKWVIAFNELDDIAPEEKYNYQFAHLPLKDREDAVLALRRKLEQEKMIQKSKKLLEMKLKDKKAERKAFRANKDHELLLGNWDRE